MRFVYILEDDQKFQKEMVDAIISIDPQIQIRLFSTLEKFAAWVKFMMTTGVSSIPQGGETPSWLPPVQLSENEQHQLAMVISKVEYLGSKQIPLMKKTRDLFISRNICTKEDPTAFVLTTFEDPMFKIKELEDRILNNIIFKPFDKLILTQHLTFAIDGRHPPSKYAISNQKTAAIVEMLKEVKMVAISEVGFLTTSNRKLEKGKVSKYYGNCFVGEKQKSLMAVTVDCKEVPDKTDEFLTSFMYFGVNPEQVSSIRKNIKTKKTNFNHKWEEIFSDSSRFNRPLGVVLIDEEPSHSDEMVDTLSRNFESFQFAKYQSLPEFLVELDPKLVETKGEAAPPKAFPPSTEIEFIFDVAAGKIEEIKSSSKDPITVFGKRSADITTQITFWSNSLGTEQLNKWKDWALKPKDIILTLKVEKNTFYIKPKNFQRDPKTKKISVKFEELSTQERSDYVLANSKIPQHTDLVFVSHRFIKNEDHEKWLKIKDLLKQRSKQSNFNTILIMIGDKGYSDSDLVLYGKIVNDIIYRPIDRSYLLKKVRIWFPELKTKEADLKTPTMEHIEEIFTASPVQISEISEAGIVMQYYRAISLGAFREFILWQPHEVGAPRMIGTCNYNEETSQKGIFNNHFIFFGMTDHFLKSIRVWIRDNYITQKEQGN